MPDHFKSILFAGVMAIVCSSLLTGVSSGLKDHRLANVALDKKKHILKVVGLLDPQTKPTRETIETRYAENIRQVHVDESGAVAAPSAAETAHLPVYYRIDKGDIQAYAIPINSRGLWGRIYGYLALDKDGATITGFTVYQHSETPGLGGEIEKTWFQKNFIGKKIVDREGNFASIVIAKGQAQKNLPENQRLNYVDGISGATLTGKYLTLGIRETLNNYEPVSIQFRKNRLRQPDGNRERSLQP